MAEDRGPNPSTPAAITARGRDRSRGTRGGRSSSNGQAGNRSAAPPHGSLSSSAVAPDADRQTPMAAAESKIAAAAAAQSSSSSCSASSMDIAATTAKAGRSSQPRIPRGRGRGRPPAAPAPGRPFVPSPTAAAATNNSKSRNVTSSTAADVRIAPTSVEEEPSRLPSRGTRRREGRSGPRGGREGRGDAAPTGSRTTVPTSPPFAVPDSAMSNGNSNIVTKPVIPSSNESKAVGDGDDKTKHNMAINNNSNETKANNNKKKKRAPQQNPNGNDQIRLQSTTNSQGDNNEREKVNKSTTVIKKQIDDTSSSTKKKASEQKNPSLETKIVKTNKKVSQTKNGSKENGPIAVAAAAPAKLSPKPDKQQKQQSKKKSMASTVLPATGSSIPPNQSQQTSNLQYGKGDSITILHVAEKPSIATAIANGLSPSAGGMMRNKTLPVHEFDNPPFPKAPFAAQCHHRVTSVVGHVFSVDFPSQFQSWESVDPAELFLAPIVRTPCKGSVVKHLQDEARNVNFIVLWMDCDREGENINFEVLDCCMNIMKSSGEGDNYDRVYRAYFSAINPSDIQKAYQSLGKPDKNQALSVDDRQELDLKIGVAFSGFQTRFFQGRYGDLDSAVLSYGPCQTPTLGFCVQRHIDIETFKPEPFWVLELGVVKRGRLLKALWGSGRSFDKGRVEHLLRLALESEPIVEVTEVVVNEKKQGRLTPLNTVALLKACSKTLGIGPHAAMQTAERLYLSGYLSYPRTESTTYPQSFDISGTLSQQKADSRWGAHVRELLLVGSQKPRGGVDMGNHPPITPCRSVQVNELSGDMARVYELLVRHFIASVSHDAVWRSTRVDFNVASLADKGSFSLRGKELVSSGFLAVLLHKEYENDAEVDDDEEEEERSIPEFTKGEVIRLVSKAVATSAKVIVASGEPVRATLEIKEKLTTPPTHLTESELISMMEKHGIGTDASIATHIENVQKRNYVALATGRCLLPSKLGLVLVQGYHQIDSSLVLPQVRSYIEFQCNKIAQGQASKDLVVRCALELFRAKFDVFVSNIEKMDVLFGSSFLKLEDVGKPFTRCGFTRRYLQFIPGPPPRLYNKWTETVYPLPAGGVVKQWTGRNCGVKTCNFEMCLYTVGQPPRTFPLCPRCFNDPECALDASNLSEDAVDRSDVGKEREIRKLA